MNKLQILYSLLRVKDRIPNQHKRYMFLHHQWGYKQADIGVCEGKTQSYVSRIMSNASQEITNNDIMEISAGHFTIDDIKTLHYQPREIITDIEFMAFVNNILQLDVKHPMFAYWNPTLNKRIAALSSLGLQTSFLSKKFEKSPANITMIVKRNKHTVGQELYQRYTSWDDYKVYSKKETEYKIPKITLAGGITF